MELNYYRCQGWNIIFCNPTVSSASAVHLTWPSENANKNPCLDFILLCVIIHKKPVTLKINNFQRPLNEKCGFLYKKVLNNLTTYRANLPYLPGIKAMKGFIIKRIYLPGRVEFLNNTDRNQ